MNIPLQLKKCISNKYVLWIIGILFFFLLWEIVTLCINEPIMIFPDPITTFGKTGELLTEEYTYKCILGSLKRIGIGFLYSFLAALVVGVIAGNSKSIQKILEPTMIALKAIPTAAMVFVFLVLSGYSEAPILIVVLMAFPILYESVIAGFNNIDKDIIDTLKLDRMNPVLKVLKVKLPLSLPYLLVGLASSFALTFKVEIMAEIITGGNEYGLGTAIYLERSYLHTSDMRPVFAYSLIAIILAIIFTILARIIKNRFNLKTN